SLRLRRLQLRRQLRQVSDESHSTHRQVEVLTTPLDGSPVEGRFDSCNSRQRVHCYTWRSYSIQCSETSSRRVNFWTYIVASLRHFRRIHASVAAGVAVTTAVI